METPEEETVPEDIGAVVEISDLFKSTSSQTEELGMRETKDSLQEV